MSASVTSAELERVSAVYSVDPSYQSVPRLTMASACFSWRTMSLSSSTASSRRPSQQILPVSSLLTRDNFTDNRLLSSTVLLFRLVLLIHEAEHTL